MKIFIGTRSRNLESSSNFETSHQDCRKLFFFQSMWKPEKAAKSVVSVMRSTKIFVKEANKKTTVYFCGFL